MLPPHATSVAPLTPDSPPDPFQPDKPSSGMPQGWLVVLASVWIASVCNIALWRELALDAEQRHLTSDPASSLEHGRPTKRDRRTLDKAQGKAWDSRWTASTD